MAALTELVYLVGIFDMGKMDVPVVLVFITNHGEHLSHSVVDTFYASISTGVICARCELMYPK